jgi:glyoxylase-like metal-dependent hydrolase (beta-lactamase superfamily II)
MRRTTAKQYISVSSAICPREIQPKEPTMKTESAAEISRRQFLTAAGFAAATASFVPRALFPQSGDVLVPTAFKVATTAKITVQPLRRNISVLLGPGGNIAVLTGPDGKLLVDAEIVTARPNVAAALASINADPIKQLINTHWHFDHTGGNEWVHEAGASILAQANTRKHLSKDTRVEGWKHTFPAAPAGAIPSTVFEEEYTLHMNGTTLMLKHYLPAHTDSDISVHFVEADVFHAADTFWNRNYPFVDYSTGGSIDGQIRAAEANIAKVTDKTIVISGHGAVGAKADLILFRDVLADAREKVAAMKKQGRSLAEVIAAKPTGRTDEEWGDGFMTPALFLEWVYQGV